MTSSFTGMNHVLVHKRVNTGQVSGGKGSTSQGGGWVTVGSRPGAGGGVWDREEGTANRLSPCSETSTQGSKQRAQTGGSPPRHQGELVRLFYFNGPWGSFLNPRQEGSSPGVNSEPVTGTVCAAGVEATSGHSGALISRARLHRQRAEGVPTPPWLDPPGHPRRLRPRQGSAYPQAHVLGAAQP